MHKLLIFLLLFSGFVKADFNSALDIYAAGDYAATHQEFYSMAIAGEKQSQFNLGVMYFYGQHVPKDINKAYAWLKLSVDSELATEAEKNTFRAVTNKVVDLVSAEEEYESLKQRYSTPILLKNLYPEFVKAENENAFLATPIKIFPPKYPRKAALKRIQGSFSI